MAFDLRVATALDIPAIEALIAASVRALQTEYTQAQRELALQSVFTVDTRLIGDGTYFILEDSTGVLAACGGWSFRATLYGGDHQVEQTDPGLLDPAHDRGRIRAIFVHPAFSRMGLGSRILEAAERAAYEAGFRHLEMASTLAGLPLYSLRGWRAIARMDVPVGAGQNITVVHMIKDLDGG